MNIIVIAHYAEQIHFLRGLVTFICRLLLWSPYGIGQTIIFSSCGFFFFFSFFLSFFFPRLISAVADWMSVILPHMVWPECEFKMQVWDVLHAARCNYRTQKIIKNLPSGHHREILSSYIFSSKATIGKKLVKQQYLLHMSSQYGELRPTGDWDRYGSLGHPSRFQRVSRLGSVTAATSLNRSQPNFARCLAVSSAGTLHIHFRGFLPRYGILPGAKLTLHPPSFGSVTAQHLNSGREPNFAALSTGRHIYSAGRPSRWALTYILVL